MNGVMLRIVVAVCVVLAAAVADFMKNDRRMNAYEYLRVYNTVENFEITAGPLGKQGWELIERAPASDSKCIGEQGACRAYFFKRPLGFFGTFGAWTPPGND